MPSFQLHLPVSGPLLPPPALLSGPYDISSADPGSWRLGIRLETVTGAMVAICSGELSAVPPAELPNKNVAPLQPPTDLPATITLYLRPLILLPNMLRAFNRALQAANLGKSLRCFVYENVDPLSLDSAVLAAIMAFRPLDEPDSPDPHQPQTRFDDPEDRLKLFAKGEFSVGVRGGDFLGMASAVNAQIGYRRFDASVWTSIGRVDPIAFFTAMGPFLTPLEDLPTFAAQVGTGWPAPDLDTAAHATASCQARLYPFPALSEARQRLALSSSDWDAIGKGQKEIYWQQLRVRAGFATGQPSFQFRRDDLENPFQLEAVSEFYVHWPEPEAQPPTAPLSQVPPNPTPSLSDLVLQRPGTHLVIVDPFDALTATGDVLPGPQFQLSAEPPPVALCSASPSALPDAYQGVLFVVHEGEIVGWFRWSTFSSHRWQDALQVRVDDFGSPVYVAGVGQPLCAWAASIRGNARYNYNSEPADKSSFINFGFRVWDPVLPNFSAPCRFYFQPGSPAAPAHGRILIHQGQSADLGNPAFSYSGSNGGLVSPDFYQLRNLLIELYLFDYETANQQTDDRIEPLRNADASASVSTFKDNTAEFPRALWRTLALSGFCWVIRPDEPQGK